MRIKTKALKTIIVIPDIDKERIHKEENKVETIERPVPTAQVNYYSYFIQNLSTVVILLYTY